MADRRRQGGVMVHISDFTPFPSYRCSICNALIPLEWVHICPKAFTPKSVEEESLIDEPLPRLPLSSQAVTVTIKKGEGE